MNKRSCCTVIHDIHTIWMLRTTLDTCMVFMFWAHVVMPSSLSHRDGLFPTSKYSLRHTHTVSSSGALSSAQCMCDVSNVGFSQMGIESFSVPDHAIELSWAHQYRWTNILYCLFSGNGQGVWLVSSMRYCLNCWDSISSILDHQTEPKDARCRQEHASTIGMGRAFIFWGFTGKPIHEPISLGHKLQHYYHPLSLLHFPVGIEIQTIFDESRWFNRHWCNATRKTKARVLGHRWTGSHTNQ